MKRILTLLLALSMLFAFVACGETNSTDNDDNNTQGDTTPDQGGTTPDQGGDTTPDQGTTTNPDQGTTTTPERANYVITVVDQNGDAVVDIQVAICTIATGVCQIPINTDANGVSTHKNKKIDSYAAQVQIPEGYTYEGEAEAGEEVAGRPSIKIPFAEGETTLTVVLTKN